MSEGQETAFHYGEACITIEFQKNNMVVVRATTTKKHEFPLRDFKSRVQFTDLVTMVNIKLPSLKTGSCMPILVKGDFYVNVRTNVQPYINFGNCIILRLGDEAADLLQFINEEFLKRFAKREHTTIRKT